MDLRNTPRFPTHGSALLTGDHASGEGIYTPSQKAMGGLKYFSICSLVDLFISPDA